MLRCDAVLPRCSHAAARAHLAHPLQKSATTSLFHHLVLHPSLLCPQEKVSCAVPRCAAPAITCVLPTARA